MNSRLLTPERRIPGLGGLACLIGVLSSSQPGNNLLNPGITVADSREQGPGAGVMEKG